MEPTDLAYLAGIIDGEGYFMVTTKSRTFGLRVAVIDACLIDWLHDHFGGCRSVGGRSTSDNQVYTWTLQRQSALLPVLRGMLPFLVIKRRQAEAMIELIEHLQAMPRWDTPSSSLSPQQRLRENRRARRQEWSARSMELRAVVKAVRRV